MYIWTVFSYTKDDRLEEVSQPYVSAECVMKDWFFNHLDWKFVEFEKFSGTKLNHWQAEDENYTYVIEAQHVEGSDPDGDLESNL